MSFTCDFYKYSKLTFPLPNLYSVFTGTFSIDRINIQRKMKEKEIEGKSKQLEASEGTEGYL